MYERECGTEKIISVPFLHGQKKEVEKISSS